jgi:hypothetical protein
MAKDKKKNNVHWSCSRAAICGAHILEGEKVNPPILIVSYTVYRSNTVIYPFRSYISSFRDLCATNHYISLLWFTVQGPAKTVEREYIHWRNPFVNVWIFSARNTGSAKTVEREHAHWRHHFTNVLIFSARDTVRPRKDCGTRAPTLATSFRYRNHSRATRPLPCPLQLTQESATGG